jgi:acyl-CoA thioesterase-1
MSWLLYLFGSGLAFYLGVSIVLAAVGMLGRAGGGWRASLITIIALIGLIVIGLSAVPLSYWLYAAAFAVSLAWLLAEREVVARLHGRRAALRLATAAIWIGAALLELPFHFAPRLAQQDNPPLLVIGDSISAGMGSGAKRLWPELLPQHVVVHNLAQPGATARSAVKQAEQSPATVGLVLVEIGGNDLLGETSPAQFERDLAQLLERVCNSQRTVLMFELPLPPLYNEFGRIQRRLAARHGVRLIPKRILMRVLAEGGATLDSIHLSDAGHQRLAEAVWTILEPACRERS